VSCFVCIHVCMFVVCAYMCHTLRVCLSSRCLSVCVGLSVCTCLFVCEYMDAHIYMYIYINMSMYIQCTHISYTYLYILQHACVCVSVPIYALPLCFNACLRVFVNVYTCTSIYLRFNPYKHTHTCRHTEIQSAHVHTQMQ